MRISLLPVFVASVLVPLMGLVVCTGLVVTGAIVDAVVCCTATSDGVVEGLLQSWALLVTTWSTIVVALVITTKGAAALACSLVIVVMSCLFLADRLGLRPLFSTTLFVESVQWNLKKVPLLVFFTSMPWVLRLNSYACGCCAAPLLLDLSLWGIFVLLVVFFRVRRKKA